MGYVNLSVQLLIKPNYHHQQLANERHSNVLFYYGTICISRFGARICHMGRKERKRHGMGVNSKESAEQHRVAWLANDVKMIRGASY